MTSQSGKQIIMIDILANISKCKSNQTMKFGQLTIFTWNKNLCFAGFSTKFIENTRLAASNVFHMFTQSIKFF